jgi:hypothetical protein
MVKRSIAQRGSGRRGRGSQKATSKVTTPRKAIRRRSTTVVTTAPAVTDLVLHGEVERGYVLIFSLQQLENKAQLRDRRNVRGRLSDSSDRIRVLGDHVANCSKDILFVRQSFRKLHKELRREVLGLLVQLMSKVPNLALCRSKFLAVRACRSTKLACFRRPTAAATPTSLHEDAAILAFGNCPRKQPRPSGKIRRNGRAARVSSWQRIIQFGTFDINCTRRPGCNHGAFRYGRQKVAGSSGSEAIAQSNQ